MTEEAVSRAVVRVYKIAPVSERGRIIIDQAWHEAELRCGHKVELSERQGREAEEGLCPMRLDCPRCTAAAS